MSYTRYGVTLTSAAGFGSVRRGMICCSVGGYHCQETKIFCQNKQLPVKVFIYYMQSQKFKREEISLHLHTVAYFMSKLSMVILRFSANVIIFLIAKSKTPTTAVLMEFVVHLI